MTVVEVLIGLPLLGFVFGIIYAGLVLVDRAYARQKKDKQ